LGIFFSKRDSFLFPNDGNFEFAEGEFLVSVLRFDAFDIPTEDSIADALADGTNLPFGELELWPFEEGTSEVFLFDCPS
jgi:hypothetical protein